MTVEKVFLTKLHVLLMTMTGMDRVDSFFKVKLNFIGPVLFKIDMRFSVFCLSSDH